MAAGAFRGTRGEESIIEVGITSASGSEGLTVDGFTIKANEAFLLNTHGVITIANNIIDGLNPGGADGGSGDNYAIAFGTEESFEPRIINNRIQYARVGFHHRGPHLDGGVIKENAFTGLLYGIVLDGGLSGIHGNVFRYNKNGVVLYNVGGHLKEDLVLAANHFNGNTEYAVNNHSSLVIVAEPNWWGHEDGPTHADNDGGEGDEVSDDVAYGEVWFTEEPVSWQKADFIITELVISDPEHPKPEDEFTLTATVKNKGNVAGHIGHVYFWPASPYEAAVVASAGVLEVDGEQVVTATVTAPDESGRKTARAEVITHTPEKSSGNNHKTTGYELSWKDGDTPDWMDPDFVVTKIELNPRPNLAWHEDRDSNDTFYVLVTITNEGDLAGDAGILRVWSSKAERADPEEGDKADTEKPFNVLEVVVGDKVGELDVGDEITFKVGPMNTTEEAGWHHARAFIDAEGKTEEKSIGNNQKSVVYPTYDCF